MVLLIPVCSLFAQDKRLHLQQADVLRNITVAGKPLQILTGNVTFTKETMTLTCDRARWSDRDHEGTLAGNVIVTKDDRTLVCDSLFYQSDQDIIKTFGNTHIWDSDYDLVSDSLLFYSSLDSGVALGHAHLLQKEQDIRAMKMIYVKHPGEDAVSYTARDSVTIIETESGRKALCGQAVYDRTRETTTLYDQPEMRDGERTLTGSVIQLVYRDEVLTYLYIPGEAQASSKSSGYRNITGEDSLTAKVPVRMTDDMSGRILKGFFTAGDLDSIRLEGMAQTLYHIFEDSVYSGRNLASGDTISMGFENQELVRIHITGGARGLYTPDTTDSELSEPIQYEAEEIVYEIKAGTSELIRHAIINQDVTRLSAGFISINWDNNLLYAWPRLARDSLTTPETPTILERGKDPMSGDMMVYNLKTRKGRVTEGRTKAADGYYQGREIRNDGTKVFYIRNSIYTTCDLDDPHFDFTGTRMKMIHNDKVISRPLIFEIHHIPLFGLPFIILPHQGGRRHSGWIMPTYGDNKNRGQYIDGAGYYWAVNDYWDITTKFGFADKQGFRLRNNIRYKKRYRFNGNLHLEGKWLLTAGQNDIVTLKKNMQRDIVFKWKHSHTLRRNQTFRANVSYYSNGAYNYQTGIDQQERLSQKAVSNITYSKRWKKSGNSFSLNLSSNQDLMVDQKIDPLNLFYVAPTRAGTQLTINSMALPNATFRLGSKNLLKPLKFLGRWTENITTSYSTSLKRTVKTYYKSKGLLQPDSSIVYDWIRSANGDGKPFSDESAGITHTYA
ncbi:MAG: putative LPS assembly protein LptD, partial [Fidelibacterota bacterium]